MSQREVKGSIVADEFVFPITDIYVEDGLFHVIAEADGPLDFVGGDVRIHDRAGGLVARTSNTFRLKVKARRGDRVHFHFRFQITELRFE